MQCTKLPALRSEVTCPTTTCGWSSRMRSSSPPAYPQPPTIETESGSLIAACLRPMPRKPGTPNSAPARRWANRWRRPAFFADLERIVHAPRRDVHAGGGDAVAELHRVVDLVDQQAAVRRLQHVDGHDAAAHGLGRRHADRVELGRDRAVARLAAARRVGDPVLGVAVDGADRLVADDKGADVALRLGRCIPGCRRWSGDRSPAPPCAPGWPRPPRGR